MKKAAELFHALQSLDELIDERGGSKVKFLLLAAAIHPVAITYDYVQERLGLTQGQVSRIARSFWSVNAEEELGLGLIDINFDPYSPRTKLISLNDKGLAMIKQLSGCEVL